MICPQHKLGTCSAKALTKFKIISMKITLKDCLNLLPTVGLSLILAQNAGADANVPFAVPGDYIVVLKQGSDPTEVANTHGLSRRQTYSHALNGFAGAIPKAAIFH